MPSLRHFLRTPGLILAIIGFLWIQYHYGVISPERGEPGRHIASLRSQSQVTLAIAEQEIHAMHERHLRKYRHLGTGTLLMLTGTILCWFGKRTARPNSPALPLLVTLLFALSGCEEKPAPSPAPVKAESAPAADSVIPLQVPEDEPVCEATHFTAKVLAVDYLGRYSGELVPVHVDPRFYATVEVLSCDHPTDLIFPQATVTFAIHSPTMIFGLPGYVGAVRKMTAYRKRTSQGVHYYHLAGREPAEE